MVFTNGQTNSFFQEADQMAIPVATVTQLGTEGIESVDDLEEFKDPEFTQLVRNLQRPPDIPDPANALLRIRQNPFVLGAKSLKRLKVAANAVRYYESVGRELTPNSMHYVNTLKKFDMQWTSLLSRDDDNTPEVPKITRNLRVTRWSEAFNDFLHRVNGVRHAPLAYVIRADAEVPAIAPPLMRNQPHSAVHESIEGEMIARLSHDSPMFRDDNARVYHFLEEATRTTVYGASLKPFQRSKHGRNAYLALISQHAGADKWEKELKQQESFMKSRVWKGNSNFSLEKFIEQHRAAFISMQQCAEHVAFQLPNETTRVRYLTDAIQCQDAALQAALAGIRVDNEPTGMRNDFESAVTFLLPVDPVAKKRKGNGGEGNFANISSANGSNPGPKKSTGKTGVELRYYKKEEYRRLSDEQKDELREWRSKGKNGKSKGGNKGNKRGSESDLESPKAGKIRRAEIASVFKEERQKIEKEQKEDEDKINEFKDILVSFTHGTKSAPGPASSTTAAATKLHGILKRGTTASRGSGK